MKTQIELLIQQIRTDIERREKMPKFGVSPDAAMVRINTINATQRSFTVETVELLLAELDKMQQHSSAIIQSEVAHEQEPFGYVSEKCANAQGLLKTATWELFRKPTTIGPLSFNTPLYLNPAPSTPAVLPPEIARDDADEWWMYQGGRVGGGAAHWYNKAIADAKALGCKSIPAAVLDEAQSRQLFESWFAADCSFDRSPEATDADNCAWKESLWYTWEKCRAAIFKVQKS